MSVQTSSLRIIHYYYFCVLLVCLTFVYFMLFKESDQVSYNPFVGDTSTINIDISNEVKDEQLKKTYFHEEKKHTSDNLKHILVWTSPKTVPFVYLGKGQKNFKDLKCEYTNCFVTSDRNYLGDITLFDVILFHGPEVRHSTPKRLPLARSETQKYVFCTIESSHNYPVCNDIFNNYFNWTWTYRLDSNCRWGYVAIRNATTGEFIGPYTNMHWIEAMDPISEELKEKLKTKTKAVAWFVSNCVTVSKRERLVTQIVSELKKYNLTVDIYGKCGDYQCPSANIKDCRAMLERDYYFYFSFENSISEDYVTEKLVTPLQANTVPIVYGGANYTRFLPDGAYLNAYLSTAENIAMEITRAINNPEVYHNYFRWKKYYTYHRRNERPDTNDYCQFCKLLNNETALAERTVYTDFAKWWNPPSENCNKKSG